MHNYSQKIEIFSSDSKKFIDKTIQTYLNSYLKKSFVRDCYDRQMSYFEQNKNLPFTKNDFLRSFSAKNFWRDYDDCGSYIELRYYFQRDKTKVHTANFCKKDKLCPACAVRRAYKQQQKFIQIYDNNFKDRDLDWYYIVLPVKHNKTEPFEVVFNRLNVLKNNITKSIRDKTMNNFFSVFGGGMYSIETTKSDNGWNVHLNFLINAPKGSEIDLKVVRNRKGQVSYQNQDLGLFMSKYADNSLMHNIQKLNFMNIDELKSALVEVVKYSLKFSSLSNQDLLQFFVKTYRKRLFGTFGNLWGLGLDDVDLVGDDVIDDKWLEIILTRSFDSSEYIYKSIKEVSIND